MFCATKHGGVVRTKCWVKIVPLCLKLVMSGWEILLCCWTISAWNNGAQCKNVLSECHKNKLKSSDGSFCVWWVSQSQVLSENGHSVARIGDIVMGLEALLLSNVRIEPWCPIFSIKDFIWHVGQLAKNQFVKNSTRLNISRVFLMKKVAMAIRIKNFGLQKIKKGLRFTPKSCRGGCPPPHFPP